jgi:hypothetical protein
MSIKIRVRSAHWLPKRLGVSAIVLYPFVLFEDELSRIDPITIQHEVIHLRQICRDGWLCFYARYAREYLMGRLRGLTHLAAYRNISYEREAYEKAPQTRLSQAERSELGLV